MLQETYGERPRLLPMEKHNSHGAPKEKLRARAAQLERPRDELDQRDPRPRRDLVAVLATRRT